MNKTKYFIPLLLLSLSSGVFAQSRRSVPIVAVFDIEDQGSPLEAEEVLGLSNYFSTKLSEGGAIFVIPRDEVRKRITQQKLESQKECFDSSCQIAIGRELAAEFSINSSISRIGSKCIITSKLFNLQTATSVAAASAKKACIPDELIEGIEEIATKFIQAVGIRHTDTKTANQDRGSKVVDSAKQIIEHSIDTIVKTKGQSAETTSPSSGITIKEEPYPNSLDSSYDAEASAPDVKTGWSLGAGIAGLVAMAAVASTGFYGAATDDESLTLPLSVTSASLQLAMVPVIKIGSKSATGQGVWGSTGVEVAGWITYGIGTAFWAISGFMALNNEYSFNKTSDFQKSGIIFLYIGTTLGTISTAFMSIDCLIAHSQANSLISSQSSGHGSDRSTEDGLSIAPSVAPVAPPAQHPGATGMMFGIQGRF